jgi:DNA-binding beta-propeller fold protein YncE
MSLYRNGLALVVIIIPFTVQAIEALDVCINDLGPCGLVLTPVATPPLTVLNCSNPVGITYLLTNVGSAPVMLESLSVTPNLDNAVSDGMWLGCGPSCCNNMVTLYGGGGSASQCLVYLNFAPCSTGLLDYTLTIVPNSIQRPLNWDISADVGSGYNNVYVVNAGSNSISYCPLNDDGTFGSGSVDSTTCTPVPILDDTSTNILNNPWGMTFDPTGEYVYISNQGDNSVSFCPVTGPGEMGTCEKLTDVTFLQPYGMSVNVVESGNLLYVANKLGNNISICGINGDGTLAPCTTAPAGDEVLGITPEDIVVINNGGLALIANTLTNNISIMEIDDFGNLIFVENRTDPTLNGPTSLAPGLNNVYVSNGGNNTVAICNGTNCAPMADDANGLLADPAGLFIAGNTIYISNLDENGSDEYTITTCSLDPSDGSFIDSSCMALLDESFSAPSDILFTP